MVAKKALALTAFVDGASRGNPGPSAAGVVLQDASGEEVKTLSVAIGSTTNNVAEYTALLLAMQEALFLGADRLTVYTDSELVARQWSGQYKIKEPSLKVLHLLATSLRRGFKKIDVHHVPREQNKLADAEANRALNQEDLFA